MEPIAMSENICLRDPIPSDIDHFIHWMTHGEWRHYDAPWEGVMESMTPEKETNFRTWFSEKLFDDLPTPRSIAVVVLCEGSRPVGRVIQ